MYIQMEMYIIILSCGSFVVWRLASYFEWHIELKVFENEIERYNCHSSPLTASLHKQEVN